MLRLAAEAELAVSVARVVLEDAHISGDPDRITAAEERLELARDRCLALALAGAASPGLAPLSRKFWT
jgi:hypothetical protein